MYRLIITVFILFSNTASGLDPVIKTATVTEVSGEAPLIRSDLLAQTFPATFGSTLVEKDTLMTGPQGSAVVRMDRDTAIALSPAASLTFNSRWQVIHNAGSATFALTRHPGDSLEIIAPFASVFASRATLETSLDPIMRITLLDGNAHLRNFLGLYKYYCSDITCGESFVTATPMFDLKKGETVTFVPPYAVKTCKEVGEALVNDDQSIILFFRVQDGRASCNAKTRITKKESDVTRIQKKESGCFLQLENGRGPCLKLAQKNTLFSLFNEKDAGIAIELRALDPTKESYVQFRCGQN
jgi:hypothetical protein